RISFSKPSASCCSGARTGGSKSEGRIVNEETKTVWTFLHSSFFRLHSPVHFPNRRLIHRLDDEFVNVDVSRAAGDPDQNFRDVGGGQRIHAFINLFGLRGVAPETHDGKF